MLPYGTVYQGPPEDSSPPHPGPPQARHNDAFARDSRCLLFATYSHSLRDCRACRTIAWCKYYDDLGVRQPDLLALERWEDEGGPASAC